MQVELIIAIASVAASVVGFVFNFIKSFKTKSNVERLCSITKIARVLQKLPDFINQAEESVGSGNGATKKTLVLQNAEIACSKEGVAFDSEGFNSEIERLLSTPQKKIEKGEING